MANVLDRETARAQTSAIRELGGPALRMVVDEASRVFERCAQSAGDGDENLGVLLPVHLGIEMLDGAEVLLDASCVVASRLPLRAALEASWALTYILEQDTKQRALAYVVGDVHERLRWYDQHNPSTAAGKQFEEMISSQNQPGFPSHDKAELVAGERTLRELLDSEAYSPINDEWQSTATRLKRKYPHWYSLFGGPTNLRDLAAHVDGLADYVLIYKEWSLTTHALDLSRQVQKRRSGVGAAVSKIRSPIAMRDTYIFACGLGTRFARQLLESYRPGELGDWAERGRKILFPKIEALQSIEEVIP